MTQTTLRDGEAVRRRDMHHAADDCAPLSGEFLIANPRLTFGVSCTKNRVLKISNRERIAIFVRIHMLGRERSAATARLGEIAAEWWKTICRMFMSRLKP